MKAEFDKDRADALLAKLEEEKNAEHARLVSLHQCTIIIIITITTIIIRCCSS
jgi:hypothetical protein